jgi:MFS family permease
MASQSVVMVVAAPVSGALSDRIGSRLLSTSGLVLMGAGLLLLAGLGPASALRSIIVALGVVGLGAGLFTSPNNSALLGSAPRERQGVAAAIMATSRNVGMVLGARCSPRRGRASSLAPSWPASEQPYHSFAELRTGAKRLRANR